MSINGHPTTEFHIDDWRKIQECPGLLWRYITFDYIIPKPNIEYPKPIGTELGRNWLVCFLIIYKPMSFAHSSVLAYNRVNRAVHTPIWWIKKNSMQFFKHKPPSNLIMSFHYTMRVIKASIPNTNHLDSYSMTFEMIQSNGSTKQN